MRNRSIVTCVLSCAAAFAAPIISSAQEIEWIGNYDEAFARAKQSGKPILLTFRCVP